MYTGNVYLENPPAAAGEAIDLSHHLSILARNRSVSPLKQLQKYWGKAGLPSPKYFPFETVKADVLLHDKFPTSQSAGSRGTLSWLWNLLSGAKPPTNEISVPKYSDDPNGVQLATALQYGMASGLPQLNKFCTEISREVYKPAFSNFKVILHAGNTDAWAKTVTTLCNPGEGVLCDEWTYPSAVATMIPYNIVPVPVAIDDQGMRPEALRVLLSSWDEVATGRARPHVMYIVPIGQNPTGATMDIARKKELYDICVEFDVIIVEDDPYYFLQEGRYVPPSQGAWRTENTDSDLDDESFIASLSPSFLRIDYQGRVIRLDSFSKTIAPGCRLGWFTCNPLFVERLERAGETSSQMPCGFSQSIVCTLMEQWQFTGYIRWMKGLIAQYRRRRDLLIDQLIRRFDVELEAFPSRKVLGRHDVYHAYPRKSLHAEKSTRKHIFSFVPPTSGMYVWLKFNFEGHPLLQQLGEESLEQKLWVALAEGGLLVGAGFIFAADSTVGSSRNSGHFRISFSYAEDGVMEKAVDILVQVVNRFYDEL